MRKELTAISGPCKNLAHDPLESTKVPRTRLKSVRKCPVLFAFCPHFVSTTHGSRLNQHASVQKVPTYLYGQSGAKAGIFLVSALIYKFGILIVNLFDLDVPGPIAPNLPPSRPSADNPDRDARRSG